MSQTSPLHAPRFPIPAEHKQSSGPSSYAALPINSPADSAVVEMSGTSRPGPLKELPVGLYIGHHAASGAVAEKPATNNIEQAAVAGVGAATPPSVDDDQWYRAQINYVRNQVEQIENADVQRGQEAQNIRSKWKRALFLLFEDPSSSPSAFVMNIFVTFMIIFSAVLTTIETIPSLRKGNTHIWLAFELIIVAVFTLEFVLRFLGHTDTWKQAWNHAKSAITIIDALAIFPFYIELILQRDTSYEFRFTILRIFRLLRVFSAFKYSSLLQLSIEVMIVAIKRSSDALLAFLLFVTLTVLLFSTLMYFAERGTWNEERQAFLTSEGEYSKFSSIPAAAYYSIVTLTTTGFGDMVPTTFIGKLVSFPMMIAGILLIALPSIIVGRNFTQVWEAARKLRSQRPNLRPSRMGESLVTDDNESSFSTYTPRRRRLRKRNYHRRSGSISSFESGSPHISTRSGKSNSGYANISGGQRNESDAEYSNVFAQNSSDPLDALARKDSFEMQELAARPADPAMDSSEERADGYRQVETIYRDNDHLSKHSRSSMEHSNGRASKRASQLSRKSAWRSPRMRRAQPSIKGKERELPAENSNGNTVPVSRLEWESLHAELATLRETLGSNEQVLRAIASHLSIGVPE
ncbi:hypothetical protein LPJ55_005584 [Coemansia sp. RSA 990]|nr:hypothetical protein LPJ68_005374 [Coemansia sp. RSA 1086]KAJ1869120.1 hypothetical protein LPJ55_005584 [Coemansia sp. RSA 990]